MLLFRCGLVVLTFNAAFGCSESERQQMLQQVSDPCGASDQLSVQYGSSALPCAYVLPGFATNAPPSVQYANAFYSRKYTLLMVTTGNAGSELQPLTFFIQWAVKGIQGHDIVSGNLPRSTIDYWPPSSMTSQPYDYKFLLFEEPKSGDISIAGGIRTGFDLWRFMTTNNMCSAVAMFEISINN